MKKSFIYFSVLSALFTGCSSSMQEGGQDKQSSMYGSEESDESISDQVREAIKFDDMLSETTKQAVHVETNHGVVTLRGEAMNKQEIRRIEKLASSVKGVTSVNNQLRLIAVPKSNQ